MTVSVLKIGVLAYLNREGRTCMLMKRSPGHYMDGLCVAPGGKRLPNESLEEAAERETLEETGIRPLDLRLKGIIHFPDYGDSPFGAEWLCFVFTFTRYDGTPFSEGPEGKVVMPLISDLPNLPMWHGDRIFTPWVFEDGEFSASFTYRGKELETWKVRRA
ncbi:MAG: hypothetical protein Kow00107_10400 [Planctomycetota bacterium]